MKPTHKIFGVASAVAWIMTGSSMAAVIYQDTFNRDSTLNGNQINVSTGFTGTGSYGGSATAQWVAGGSFATSSTTGLVSAAGSTSAYLPFIPQAGNIYTLSASMQSLGANWVALGFATVNFASPTTASWHASNSPVSWVLMRTGSGTGKVTFFGGPGASDSTSPSVSINSGLNTLTFVLDTQTNVNNWTSTLYLNGVSTGVSRTYSAASWTANAIGFGDNGSDSLRADSFSLTTNIPEPSAALLGAFGMLALLRRRR